MQASPSLTQRRQESSPDWTNPHSQQKGTIQLLQAFIYHDKARWKNPNVLVYGTDREKALSEGFGRRLPYAQHLLWDLHKKDDVMSKMNKLGMWGKPLEIILSDIFRREIGCKRVSGLTDLQIHTQFVTSLKKKLRSGFLYTHSQSALLFTFLSIG